MRHRVIARPEELHVVLGVSNLHANDVGLWRGSALEALPFLVGERRFGVQEQLGGRLILVLVAIFFDDHRHQIARGIFIEMILLGIGAVPRPQRATEHHAFPARNRTSWTDRPEAGNARVPGGHYVCSDAPAPTQRARHSAECAIPYPRASAQLLTKRLQRLVSRMPPKDRHQLA